MNSLFKYFLCLLIVLSTKIPVAAQSAKIDSLLKILKTAREDTNKVNLLIKIAQEKFSEWKGDTMQMSMVTDLNSARELSEKIGFKKGQINAYSRAGTVYIYGGRMDKARDYLNKGLSLAKASKDEGFIFEILIKLGSTYWKQGNYSTATNYYYDGLKIAEHLNNQEMLAKAYNNLGNIYVAEKDFEKGLDFHRKALFIRLQLKDSLVISHSYLNIGNCYLGKMNFDSAVYFYNQALIIQTIKKNYTGQGYSLDNIAEAYSDQLNYQKALEYLLRANEALQAGSDFNEKINNNTSLGDVYYKLNRYDDALRHYFLSMKPAEEGKLIAEMKNVYAGIAQVYESKKDYPNALKYYKMYTEAKDSVYSNESAERISSIEFKYQTEKDNKIRALEDQKKEDEHSAEVRQQRTIIYSVSFGLALLVIFSIFIFRGYRQKQKANEIIALQKELVEERNKDITDSINYAKRIQEAILPDQELLKKLFPNAFMLFLPRDIVSGDFYWFSEKNGKRLVAAVDCTGHGVPGAFMSMVGNAFLNEIVNEKGITEPGLILSELRFLIIKALKQTGAQGEQNDGMDISLLCFDENPRFVEYAGANNPMWLVRNGECIEYKADKRPIGYFRGKGLPFGNHKIELEKGDSLYIFTDGYADQFGGEKGKKFKYKQMMDLILSIQDKTMPEQENILKSAFKKWRGSLEQVDDVLIIGLKV